MTSLFDAAIQFEDQHEIQEWAKLFGISVQDLSFAISRAGPNVKAVAHDLKIVPDLPKRDFQLGMSPFLLPRAR